MKKWLRGTERIVFGVGLSKMLFRKVVRPEILAGPRRRESERVETVPVLWR